MSLSEAISAILADIPLDDDLDPRDSSRGEELAKLVHAHGWQALELEMLDVLLNSSNLDHWNVAAGFFWGTVLDQRPDPADRKIAHLCYRFPPSDNLVWSIIVKLKELPYDSDYDPLRDPAVAAELRAVEVHERP